MPRRINTKKNSPEKIKGRLLKTEDKKQILEAERGRCFRERVLHTAAPGTVTADLSPETLRPDGMQRHLQSAEMLQERKTLLRGEGKIDIFGETEEKRIPPPEDVTTPTLGVEEEGENIGW